ncbi:hypothetical protein BGZ61DRAFT_556623 [Ilyonectria robusta]|uniref:uncharacterized protein n=1 Tax=Ilyonectria robusta TaxID=1079257 RepID=UPI001E8CB3CB|nr:uncharacterized protein BGZ61DRAFT_556623 [Ilyonectria robusta]KAH8670545.1 hypothetical protein BGZ61DRAFT_556623 [Ilyonectria robusta]
MKAASNQYALRINLQYTAKAFLATKLSKHLNAVAFLLSQPKESPRFLRLGAATVLHSHSPVHGAAACICRSSWLAASASYGFEWTLSHMMAPLGSGDDGWDRLPVASTQCVVDRLALSGSPKRRLADGNRGTTQLRYVLHSGWKTIASCRMTESSKTIPWRRDSPWSIPRVA